MRTIVIGDIHGCVEEFAQLIIEVGYKKGEDRLLLLGDLIDRGPDPAGVIRLARDIGAESIMGNHEEKALRWRKHEKRRIADPTKYKNPMSSVAASRLVQWSAIPDEHWDWIETWPVYAHINDKWSAVHGGCLPDVEVEKQLPNEVMRLRYVKTITTPSGYPKYKMASLNEKGEAPENSIHWTELWMGPRNIVYGHYTRDDILITFGPATTIGLDSGCVHGGTLSAAIFIDDGFTTYQVKAKQVYVPRGPWNDIMD